MPSLPIGFLFCLTFWAGIGHAADADIYTIVDGDARVLRGPMWFKLVAGARAQEGDVVEVSDRGQVQLETLHSGTLSAQGPAHWLAISLSAADDKAGVPTEFLLARGWFKAAVPATRRQLRLRLPTAAVDLADAVAVLHADTNLAEFFVEAGTARVSVPVARGKEAPPLVAQAGEFWTRTGERPFVTVNHSPAFVTVMPRQLRDALPALASHFARAPPPLTAGHDIALAEAEPWLAGPARKTFIRRLTPRLADPAFRAGVNAHIAAYPEWDRILHPEKYQPKPPTGTNAITGVAGPPLKRPEK